MSISNEMSYVFVMTLMIFSFTFSSLLIPILIRLANRLAIVDIPNQYHKTHKISVPYLGGASLLIPIIFLLVYLSIESPIFTISAVDFNELVFLSGCMFAVGLADDVKSLSVRSRFIYQIIIATSVGVLLMRKNHLVQVTTLEAINLLFAIIWIVGVTNAFNLFDNLDGAVASVIITSSAGISFLAWRNNQNGITIVALILLSASCGFLIWNFQPARIYLGDAGALFSGFLISILLYQSVPKTGIGLINLATPLLLILLPLADTLLVIGSRIITGSRLFYGNRDHLAHRLLISGFSIRQIWGLCFGVSLLVASAAVFLQYINVGIAFFILGTILTLIIYIILIFWRKDFKNKKSPNGIASTGEPE